MVLLVEVISMFVPIHELGADGPHVLLMRFFTGSWPCVVSGFLEVFLDDQIGDRCRANLLPTCRDALKELGDASRLLGFLILLILASGFNHTCLA